MEIFHLFMVTKNFDLSSLNLRLLGGSLLWPKDNWKYLSFIFNRKLFFCQHIYFANKALFTIKDMKMLDNSTRDLLPTYKWLVRVKEYRLYLFSISLSLLFYFLFIFILRARVIVWHDLVSHISHSHMTLSQLHSYTIMCHNRRQ